jgi:Putative restriction endonuclease
MRTSQKLDRTTKKTEYAAFGIRSYWLVTTDRALPTLTAYELRRGEYHGVGVVAGADEFRTRLPFPFSVVPSLLVADSDTWTAALHRLTQ